MRVQIVFLSTRLDTCISMDHLNPVLQSQSEEMGKEVAWNLAVKEFISYFKWDSVQQMGACEVIILAL